MENTSQKKIKHPSLKKGFKFLSVAIIFFLIGFMAGFGEGANYAFQKGLIAVEAMLDIQLSGKAKNMIMGFPDIWGRIDKDTRDKLGLNASSYYNESMNKLNETLTKLTEFRYPTPHIISSVPNRT